MDKFGISLSLRYMFLLPPFMLQGLIKLWLWWCQYKIMYLVRCCYCRFFNLNTRLNIYFFLYCLLIHSSFNLVLWWYFSLISNPFIPSSIFPSPLGWNGWGELATTTEILLLSPALPQTTTLSVIIQIEIIKVSSPILSII